jgi:hypothetical protein
MPDNNFSQSHAPESSPAARELNRRSSNRSGGYQRWSGRPCDLVPDGMLFYQMDRGDRQRYEQAGCTYMGAQSARRTLTVGGSQAGSPIRSVFTDTWCCQPQQVLPVFEEWVASDEYKRRRYYGLAFAGLLIFGTAYLILNRKKLGVQMSGERHSQVSFAANPYDDEEDYDMEE